MTFWQNPYVSVFKTFKLTAGGAPGVNKSQKKGETKGDVKEESDHDIRSSVWKISGTVPANNFIQFNKNMRQCTTIYFYLINS